MTHQLSTMEGLHCQFGQGFLFAQPMGMQELEVWAKKENYLN
jgi:EAL domain-containing protein (putative c-di-GMP-specific phosphodiesterase class I)